MKPKAVIGTEVITSLQPNSQGFIDALQQSQDITTAPILNSLHSQLSDDSQINDDICRQAITNSDAQETQQREDYEHEVRQYKGDQAALDRYRAQQNTTQIIDGHYSVKDIEKTDKGFRDRKYLKEGGRIVLRETGNNRYRQLNHFLILKPPTQLLQHSRQVTTMTTTMMVETTNSK